MKIGIASGGTLTAAFLQDFLRKEEIGFWIAAEGGARLLLSCHIRPDLVIGDFDTVGSAFRDELMEAGIRVLAFPSEKDETDTGLCLAEAVRMRPDGIVLLGATGTRLDHMLGNVALLRRLAEDPEAARIRVRLVDEHQTAFVLTGEGSVRIPKADCPDRYLSILALSEKAEGITLTGVYYPLDDANLRASDTVGISNRITAEEAVVSLRKGTLLIILARD